MRSLLAGFAALLASFVILPSIASADQLTFIGRCQSCGVPMYGQTVMSGYDRYGYPVYRTIPVSHYCQAQRFDGYRGNCRDDHHRGYDRSRHSGYEYRSRTGFGITIFR